jgi:uncharacterized protein (TIGR03546 family)
MFLLNYLEPLRNALRIFTAERTPHQLALGCSLGMLIGILPKGNLLAVAATVLLFALRVNLGTGLTAIFLLSAIGTHLDQLTHGLGVRLLRTPAVYAFLSWSYQFPLVPWTSLNNTVVIGSLLLGLVLLYPVYHVSRAACEWLTPICHRLRRRWTRTASTPAGQP